MKILLIASTIFLASTPAQAEWKVGIKTDKLTDDKIIYAITQSTTPYHEGKRLKLVYACKENTGNTLVNIGAGKIEIIDSEIDFRFDEKPALTASVETTTVNRIIKRVQIAA